MFAQPLLVSLDGRSCDRKSDKHLDDRLPDGGSERERERINARLCLTSNYFICICFLSFLTPDIIQMFLLLAVGHRNVSWISLSHFFFLSSLVFVSTYSDSFVSCFGKVVAKTELNDKEMERQRGRVRGERRDSKCVHSQRKER